MSLRINHNLTAINANRNLKATTGSLQKSMQKLSSGFRINAAADDPAGLVISEQFRAQIAGLNRAISNSEGSVSMIQTAEGALTEINSLLISMRELAIHAANEGFNDTNQLAADQAEIANAIKTIDRIAATTQFGTKKILDGSKDNIATIVTANSSKVAIKTSNLSSGQHNIVASKKSDPTSTLNTTSLGLSLANVDGDPDNLEEKIHAIDVLQASDVAKKTSGQVSLSDAFGNGLRVQTAASAANLVSGASVAGTVAAANAGNYTFTVNYQENGESPVGAQSLVVAFASGDTMSTIAGKLQTEINLNAFLAGKVTATASATTVVLEAANAGAQYSVKLESLTSNATTAFFTWSQGSSRGISANTLDVTVNTVANANVNLSIQVRTGTYSSMAGSTGLLAAINGSATIGLNGETGAVGFGTIGAGVQDVEAFSVGTNQIEFRTKDEGSSYWVRFNDDPAVAGNLINVLKLTKDTSNVTGTDALVSFDGYTNTISSVKYNTPTTPDVFALKNKADGASGQGSVQMVIGTALTGIKTGSLLLDVKAARFDVRLDGGPAYEVAAGKDAIIYNASRNESLIVNYDLRSLGGSETINNTDQSLVFQIGPNVGQTTKIGIRSMTSSSLAKSLPGNLFASLAEIDVTTVQGAQDAQSLIDAAINEVTTTRGTLGSFQKNTLESNLRNLRIASQNLTASESMIRDTDMAEEMSEFTKNQILVQAGTAMLAQSNQLPQVVLSLFQ